jgi:hypothetical protein
MAPEVYCASPKALKAAGEAFRESEAPTYSGALADGLIACHDPKLGLDRSVCLRDVVDALRNSMDWIEDDAYADWVAERFGGTSASTAKDDR